MRMLAVAVTALCVTSASCFILPSSSTAIVTSKSKPSLIATKRSIDIVYATAASSASMEEETTTKAKTKASSSSHEKIPDVNVIIDLDGNPLPPSYFEQTMDINNVEYYTCPQRDSFAGFMSHACRVYLFPGKQSAFYKSIIFENLPHAKEKEKKSPYKLLRDAKSYAVVANFLNSKACGMLREDTGVHIPKQYDAKFRPDYEYPMKSKFSFLHEDFAPADGWYQQWLLHDEVECKAALSAFAKVHAYFWHGSNFWTQNKEAAQELEDAVWKSGSYVQPSAQTMDGQCSCTKVAEEWEVKRGKFEKELSSFDYWDNLGIRLESVAAECGRLAHPFADDISEDISESYMKYRTFTHGDPKQANLFFRKQLPTLSDDDGIDLEVGLIDFQWSGFGLAATDIAHFMTSGVHADRLVDGGEKDLLQYYFDELQTHLVEYGAYSSADEAIEKYSYETFMEGYDTGVLDIVRLVIAYTWARFEDAVEKEDEEGCAKTMNKTSYNKSIPNVIWLMSRCDEILKSRGV